MNRIKYLLALSFLLFFGGFYGMNTKKRGHEGAPSVDAYFVPKDDTQDKLFSFLDNAKKEILVAMYWILDDSIISRLISEKGKGKDVQIIIDESTFKYMGDSTGITFINRLLRAGIVPMVYPSGPEGSGIMHNKFVVVDGTNVFTGSANFTKTAFNIQSPDFLSNHENIIIVKNSNKIGQKYRSAFEDIETVIFDLYIEVIANNDPNNLPDWFNHLLPKLPQDRLGLSRQVKWGELDQTQRARIQSFFREQPSTSSRATTSQTSSRRAPTEWQEGVLRRNGYSQQEINAMSYQEAYDLIGAIMASQPAGNR